MWWIILIIIVVLILIYLGSTYNSFVVLRNRVKDQWAQIDVQLKRRFDLIPNLVETVKGYASHEKYTLEAVVKARNEYLSSDTPEGKIEANNDLNKVVTKLFALAESYPELKADTNFRELQTTLTETEDKISYARQFYNDVVMKYNNKVEVFPSNIVAGMFGFKTSAYFNATEKERENVKVKF
ncbi:MAG: LemA family protein [Bacilli bacterium]|nr:LemA family protein [Bacilli bacterium]